MTRPRLIPQHDIDALVEGSDIVAFVSERIELTKKGRQLWAPCPFHNEKTPSFSVNPERQIFKCFGCQKGGNVLDFIQAYDRIGFREAVGLLADRAGVELEGGGRPLRRRPRPKPRRPAAPPPPKRAPIEEIEAIWSNAAPVISEAGCYGGGQIKSWLFHARGLDPWLVERQDMARILPAEDRVRRILGGRWPAWAMFGKRTWAAAGYNLIFPCYDARGCLAGLRAGTIEGRGPSRISMFDVEGRGLALANPRGRELLERGPAAEPLRIIIVEGEPDAITASQAWPEDAVLGVWSGSWSAGLASRIPSGSRVLVRTHVDAAGHRYARTIIESLEGRCECYRPSSGRSA